MLDAQPAAYCKKWPVSPCIARRPLSRDILLEESQGEGIIPAILERNRQVRCLLEYQDEKQTLGERIVTAHEAFNLALNDALMGVHSKCPGSKCPGSKCPAYHLVSILGTLFYLRDCLKYVRDALTQMTVHQIIGTQ